MSSEQFGVGDVVVLKSGSPLMTVVDKAREGWLVCNWFEDGKVQSSTFPPAALRKAEEDKILSQHSRGKLTAF
jgi:uncharacterized protein YodC (DUF2158 family)